MARHDQTLVLMFEILWRTQCLLAVYSHYVQGAWAVLKVLVQALVQKFRKSLTLDDPDVRPVSSSRG